MRVKKLEVFGFKSFAQKTTIHFEPGVTAIVGPNGVGKSNCVDAFRWVLGEHNPRDVRAPRLEDVIFNGTDRKAPLSMAEVTLTIANEQGLLPISFSEVAITRRVYRSGESEYLINQSPCRLKDIQELFLGTGLGGGTYAIIEQGHIDMILSSKPEERRVVFEEASGVAKYLAKKQETMRRLDEVEEHLVRIADIIGEVRRQVSALERAATKARQYKSQWDELKSLELRLAVDELGTGAARHRELEQRLQELTAQRDGLEAERQRHVASLEACNADVSSVQRQLHALRTAIVEHGSHIDQHENQHALKARWIEELAAQAQQAQQEAAQLAARTTQVGEQLARVSGGEAELLAQQAAIQAHRGQGGEELAAIEAAMQASVQAVTTANAQLFDAAAEASRRRNQLAAGASRLQSLEAHLTRVEGQRAERAGRAEKMRGRIEAAGCERDALSARHDDIQQRIAAAQHVLDASGERRHGLTGRLHQFREQLASQRAQVELFEALWRRYEGFPDTVKALMGCAVEGLIGPLVDVVQARPGYEAVVEAALGPLADALVVRDRPSLLRCREALEAQQLESCRFLVLSDIPDSVPMAEPVMAEVLAGTVKQYVNADAAYQPLVDWLLNDSWMIDDIHQLLSNGSAPQGRLVSPRGDRWDRRSWRLTGSRLDAHSPACADPPAAAQAGASAGRRLGRKQRWEQASETLRAIEQEHRLIEAEAHEAEQAWQSLMMQQESAKGELARATPELHASESRHQQLVHEARRIEDDACALELEAQDLRHQRIELGAAVANTHEAAEQAQRGQQAIEQSLAEAHAARETSERRRQELLIARAQVETSLASLTERLASLQTRRQELEADQAHLAQQLETKARQHHETIARSNDLTQQIAAHQQEAQQLQEARARLAAEAEQVSAALREAEARRDQALPHLLSVEQQLSSLMPQIQEQGRQLSERAFRSARLIERLQELYQIDDATLQAERQANPPALAEDQRAVMSERVQKLRAKLEGMGPVSLGSVDEYDELKRRLEFLQTQQQDLTQAREDLKTSISQINRTARAQFRETFERITQEFRHYYTRLFNGGEADLILLDQEDVLESGIDIVARPPGKRLQSITLLSGGERALTAIALLFALFKVRPSPFCILDEIDAPLDEANVDRFTRVLEEFLALSQFILITHNKKTITKADSIYGVTMEETGISKILSAKLTAADGSRQSSESPNTK